MGACCPTVNRKYSKNLSPERKSVALVACEFEIIRVSGHLCELCVRLCDLCEESALAYGKRHASQRSRRNNAEVRREKYSRDLARVGA